MAKETPENTTVQHPSMDTAHIAAVSEAIRLVEGRKRRMQLTKGARFEAARRHKFSARSSSYSIVILSVWIFAITVFVLIYPGSPDNNYLNALNLILSFFVIAFSILQGAKRHELRSEMFLKCAQEIDEISTDLSVKERESKSKIIIESQRSPNSPQNLEKIRNDIFEYVKDSDKKYQKILMSFSDNHSDMDYNIYIFKSDRNPKNMKGVPWLKSFVESAYWRALNIWYIRNTTIIAVIVPILAISFRKEIIAFMSG